MSWKGKYFTNFLNLSLASANNRENHRTLLPLWVEKKLFRSFHLQNLTNVSAKIAPLAGLHRLPPPGLILCQFRNQKTIVFRHFVSQKTNVLLCFGGFRPSNWCLLVSKRHVFYELFEPLLAYRENKRKPLYFTLFFDSQTTLFALFHLKFWTNVSSKIAPLAGLPPHPQIMFSSPSNFDECFC